MIFLLYFLWCWAVLFPEEQDVAVCAGIWNGLYFQISCSIVFPYITFIKGEKDPKSDPLCGHHGDSAYGGDPAEHRIRSIPKKCVLASVPLNMSKAVYSGIFQWDQSDGSSCRLCTGLGLSEKSGGRRNSGFLAVFFCVAVSFSVFGFSTWNPQWVLLMAPFLVLNIFMNENGNLLLMITNIFMLAMYIFCSQSMVDERVLNGGILKYILKDRNFAVRMWDVYRFHDQELLCTAMWIVLLLYVVFGHPRYHKKKGSIISRGLVMADPRGVSLCVAAFCASDVCLCDGRSAGQNSLL